MESIKYLFGICKYIVTNWENAYGFKLFLKVILLWLIIPEIILFAMYCVILGILKVLYYIFNFFSGAYLLAIIINKIIDILHFIVLLIFSSIMFILGGIACIYDLKSFINFLRSSRPETE